MAYAKISTDGSVEIYPYSLLQLKLDYPNVSFPYNLTSTDLSAFNIVEVLSVNSPNINYDQSLLRDVEQLVDGSYVEKWTIVDASVEEIEDKTVRESQTVRSIRNEKLKTSDWTQLPDAPVDSASWAVYRQALRAVPEQVGFPWTITWPTEPA